MLQAALPDVAIVAAVFLAAGAVKGVLGMGLPTLAMGLLGLFMPVATAASLLTIPSLMTNLWQMLSGPRLPAVLQRLWSMQVGIAGGVALAGLAFPAPPEALGRRLLGACLVLYGACGLLRRSSRRLPARWEALAGPLAGAFTGVITGCTGVFVLPAVPYLQSLQLGKNELAQALGLCFTTSTLALGTALVVQGHMGLRTSLGSLILVLPALLGMWLGQRVREGMSEAAFRRCFMLGLSSLGAWLALR